MALINCPECKKQISNEANECPHCGYLLNRLPVEQNKRTKRVILIILGIIIAICIIAAIYDACTVSTPELEEQLRDSVQKEQIIQDRIDDLNEQIRQNEALIDYYENKN